MHDDAELGVAAHWKYKEEHTGKLSAAEERINWLRKILAWQEEVAESGDIVEESVRKSLMIAFMCLHPRGM